MIRFMVVMVAVVFVIDGADARDNWLEALLFALAVAVGLTPEMLPMIITVCLVQGRDRRWHGKQGHREAAPLRSRISGPWTCSAPTRPAR
jgi:uncharacterized oligopeptide transporter (OPT) family protein